MNLHSVVPAVEAKYLALAATWMDESEQKAYRGRFSRAIRTQVAENFTLGDFKVEAIQGGELGVSLGQSHRAYRRICHSRLPPGRGPYMR